MKELDTIHDKALRVFSTEDGMDVLTHLFVNLSYFSTLDNPSKTAHHNFAVEYLGMLTGAIPSEELKGVAPYRAQLKAALGNLIVPEKPPMIKEGVHDRART